MQIRVYILQSESDGRFYVGIAEDVSSRVDAHNFGQTKSTRNRGPWKLVHQEAFESRFGAYTRERQIKSWKSHRSIEELIARVR